MARRMRHQETNNQHHFLMSGCGFVEVVKPREPLQSNPQHRNSHYSNVQSPAKKTRHNKTFTAKDKNRQLDRKSEKGYFLTMGQGNL